VKERCSKYARAVQRPIFFRAGANIGRDADGESTQLTGRPNDRIWEGVVIVFVAAIYAGEVLFKQERE
jgi:hypothetical protein